MKSSALEEQFQSLIDEYKGIIYKVSNSYCWNTEDRKDLVQEIIFQLWISFSKFDNRYKLSTWVYRISLNVSIAYYRKEKRRRRSILPLSENFIDVIKDKEQESLDADIATLYKFIDRFNKLDRALMILYLDSHSYKEIADILGITETNVATKLNRIKVKLKHQFSTIKAE
jgi:RNA polymerase sigma-70 factor (ECF subfamily)